MGWLLITKEEAFAVDFRYFEQPSVNHRILPSSRQLEALRSGSLGSPARVACIPASGSKHGY
jgi:hypothetical protein